jgi:hypothetical protein
LDKILCRRALTSQKLSVEVIGSYRPIKQISTNKNFNQSNVAGFHKSLHKLT